MGAVQSAVALHGPLNQGVDFRRLGDVGPEEEGVASGLMDHSHGGLVWLDGDIGHRDPGAFTSAGHGCGAANA
jgi:hypothetical protein